MKKRSYKAWSNEDKEFLKENYLFLSDKTFAELFERSEENIRKQRQFLGLTRRGLTVADVISSKPIIIWFPREAFKETEVDLTNLKIIGE